MTIEQKIRDLLAMYGLWPDKNVDAVMSIFKEKHPEIEDKVWSSSVDAYPDMLLNVIWAGVKAETLRWIDENLPQAFYRPMFTNEEISNG